MAQAWVIQQRLLWTNNEALRGTGCRDATGDEGGEEPGKERRGQGIGNRAEGGGTAKKIFISKPSDLPLSSEGINCEYPIFQSRT